MVNKIATLLLFELLPLLTVAQKDTLATKQLASVEMTQDFNYLRRLLTETHPGLYRYSSKEKMQTKMDSIYLLLAKPMAFYDYYLLLSELIANVRCAHTHLTPTNEFEKYYLNNIKTFPFMIFYTEGDIDIIRDKPRQKMPGTSD